MTHCLPKDQKLIPCTFTIENQQDTFYDNHCLKWYQLSRKTSKEYLLNRERGANGQGLTITTSEIAIKYPKGPETSTPYGTRLTFTLSKMTSFPHPTPPTKQKASKEYLLHREARGHGITNTTSEIAIKCPKGTKTSTLYLHYRESTGHVLRQPQHEMVSIVTPPPPPRPPPLRKKKQKVPPLLGSKGTRSYDHHIWHCYQMSKMTRN